MNQKIIISKGPVNVMASIELDRGRGSQSSVTAARMFDPGVLPENDPEECVALLNSSIAKAVDWQRQLRTMAESLHAEYERLTEEARSSIRHHTAADQNHRDDLKKAVQDLLHGVGPNEGVIPRLTPFVGKPGLDATEATLIHLRALRAEWQSQIGHDLNATATYRLKPGKRHRQQGRMFEGGELVELTNNQYQAFSDKFDPVRIAGTAKPVQHTTEKRMPKRPRRRAS